MASSINFQPLSNADRNNSSLAIIIIHDPESNRRNKKRLKSGLTPTSNTYEIDQLRKKLRKIFQLSGKIFTRNKWKNHQIDFDSAASVTHFHHIDEAIENIQSSGKNRFLLFLPDSYALNKEVISRFKALPRVERIYHAQSQLYQENLKKRRMRENKHFMIKRLSENLYKHSVETLDDSSKLLLIDLLLEKVLELASCSDEAQNDFMAYCRQTYENEPGMIDAIENWIENYHQFKALYWYTKCDGVAFRIISRICASADLEGLIRCRFIFYDLYKELKELHNEQLNNLKKESLVVSRGVWLNEEELSSLTEVGKLYMTRPFLSTTRDEDIARDICGYGDIIPGKTAVLITMTIDPEQIDGSLIADISQVSANPMEEEVMLFRGLVFCVQSCDKIENNSSHLVHIKLVRGADEAQIERNLRERYIAVALASGTPLLSLISLADLNPQFITDISTRTAPKRILESNPLQEPSNTFDDTKQIPNQNLNSNVGGNTSGEATTTAQSTGNANAATSGGAASTDAASKAVGATASPLVITKPIVAMLVIGAVVIVGAAIGIPAGIVLRPHNDQTDINLTPNCHTSCRFFPFVDNPSPNYQTEQLNITCNQTLINMSITMIVQRNHNETHAQQYQTFWNQSTNMAYLVTQSTIIYRWFSWNHMYIVANSFPHFIKAEYYHGSNSTRVTSNDTWVMLAKTDCGEALVYSGTF